MSKLIVTEFVTLDGVIEAPYAWSRAFWNDEIQELKRAELFGAEALLLGRVTYEGFASSWPARRGTDAFADRINEMPKYVASRTLKDASWTGTRVLGADVFAELRALKAELAGDLLVYGSNQLVVSLLGAALVDEVHVLSYPIVHGGGLRLFEGAQATLELDASRSFANGVTYMKYRPVAAAPAAAAA